MDKHAIKSRRLRRFIKNRLAVIGLAIVTLIILLAVLAPVIAPYNPLQHDYDELLLSPSFEHLMGTDDLGRDIFSRVIYGTRYALLIGVAVVVLELLIGASLGFIAGYFGGGLETVIMRGVDTVLAIPTLILAIAIAGAFGGGLWVMIIAIAVAGWGEFTRLVRAQVLSLKELTYVEAARAIGAGQARIIFNHIVPNSMGPVLVYTTLYMPTAILWSAALSFLGLGAQPPTPEWGAIIADGRAFISYAWWIATFPGLAIMVTTLGFNFVGDGLRDALDPKFERRT
ncbi:ABC transporter permease [Candidatus Bipolaricaulota bacterium]|nr:ABC transporter permease [Candidatus Bipolaricaulota bacterium]